MRGEPRKKRRPINNESTALPTSSNEASVHMPAEQTVAICLSASAANNGLGDQSTVCQSMADSSAGECPAKRPKLMTDMECTLGASMPLIDTPTPSTVSISRDFELTDVIFGS